MRAGCKEASIMYRKAIDKDRRFGVAYYKLALTDLKGKSIGGAVPALQRAVELLKPGTPDSDDATLKLSEIMVVAAQSQERNEQMLKDVTDYAAGLLKRNPNSWQGHKLTGDLAMLDTVAKYRREQGLEAKKALGKAIAEYRTALSAKPGDYIVTLALGRTLVLDGETAEAENMFKTLIEKDKKNLNGLLRPVPAVYRAAALPRSRERLLKTAIEEQSERHVPAPGTGSVLFRYKQPGEPARSAEPDEGNLKDFPMAYLQAGDFFIRVNQFDEAIKQYEEGIQKDPKQKNTYLKHEIEAYVRQNKLELAKAKNDEILKSDPKDPEARGLRATFALDKGDVTRR